MLITLSVFQGEETDKSKNQLFCAEWDDYENGDMKHPQPHWHFLSNKSFKNTTIAEIERTNRMLNMLEPITFPTAISVSPL